MSYIFTYYDKFIYLLNRYLYIEDPFQNLSELINELLQLFN